MNDKPFSEPIRLKLDSSGSRLVRSAWEGLECLSQWPAEHGPQYRAAVRTCRDALDGITPAQRANRAFRDAALAARVIEL